MLFEAENELMEKSLRNGKIITSWTNHYVIEKSLCNGKSLLYGKLLRNYIIA